jgi:hypothetical protein
MAKISDFINIKYFFISFVVGIAAVYLWGHDIKTIVVYPNPLNVNEIQYKDNTNLCFQFSSSNVKCPEDKTLIKSVPIQ